MIIAGEYQSLRVERIAEPGIYLADEQGEQILLPNRYVRIEDKVGDMVRYLSITTPKTASLPLARNPTQWWAKRLF